MAAMTIGVPREIKPGETRVGAIPAGVRELVDDGHRVLVESGAGDAAGYPDDAYAAAGAELVPGEAVFAEAALLVKVKEPQEEELPRLRASQTLFTYLHLAPVSALTQALLQSGVTGIAYETVTDDHGRLPLLRPMSEVAGRVAMQSAAWCLESAHGGRGVLLGGVPGVAPADVVILGGGVVGCHAARIAAGQGARVTLLENNPDRIWELEAFFDNRATVLFNHRDTLEKALTFADVIVGAVLLPGAATPRLVTREQLATMKAGAVLVDVSIDQGGCFETSHPTTHAEPVYLVDGVVHYCVANMPAAVPRTATQALAAATLPYIKALAREGVDAALIRSPGLRCGLNVYGGQLTNAAVGAAQGLAAVAPEAVLPT